MSEYFPDLFGQAGTGLAWKDIAGLYHTYWAGGNDSVSASCDCYFTGNCATGNKCKYAFYWQNIVVFHITLTLLRYLLFRKKDLWNQYYM